MGRGNPSLSMKTDVATGHYQCIPILDKNIQQKCLVKTVAKGQKSIIDKDRSGGGVYPNSSLS